MNLEIFGEQHHDDEHGRIVISVFGPEMISIQIDETSHHGDGVVLTTIRARQLIRALEAMAGIADKEGEDFRNGVL